MKKDNILHRLIEHNIPFAVMAEKTRLRNTNIDYNSTSYSIVIHKNADIIPKLTRRDPEYKDLKIGTLSPDQEQLFFELKDEYFDQVLRNEFGAVYELKNNSFKNHYSQFTLHTSKP